MAFEVRFDTEGERAFNTLVRGPEPVQRQYMEPVVVGVGTLAEVHHHTSDKGRPEFVAEQTQASEVAIGHGSGRLDFDGAYRARLCFDHQSHFVLIFRAKVREGDLLARPARLFHQFVDGECLDEMAELSEVRRNSICQFVLRHADHVGREASIYGVNFCAANCPVSW